MLQVSISNNITNLVCCLYLRIPTDIYTSLCVCLSVFNFITDGSIQILFSSNDWLFWEAAFFMTLRDVVETEDVGTYEYLGRVVVFFFFGVIPFKS